jgi:hypothetical protein
MPHEAACLANGTIPPAITMVWLTLSAEHAVALTNNITMGRAFFVMWTAAAAQGAANLVTPEATPERILSILSALGSAKVQVIVDS